MEQKIIFNRHTKKEQPYGSSITRHYDSKEDLSSSLFAPKLKTSLPQLLKAIPEEHHAAVKQKIAEHGNISEMHKIDLAKFYIQVIKKQAHLMKRSSGHTDSFDALQKASAEYEKNGFKREDSKNFAVELIKLFTSSLFSGYAPVTAFLLAVFPTLASAFKVHSGVPGGASDWCPILSGLYCRELYITDDQNQLLSRISVYINQAAGSKSSPTTYLLNCLDDQTVGNTVGNLLTNVTNTNQCSYVGGINAGVTPTITFEIPPELCDSAKNALAPVVQNCNTQIANISTIVGLSVGGGVLFCGIMGFVLWKCCKNSDACESAPCFK